MPIVKNGNTETDNLNLQNDANLHEHENSSMIAQQCTYENLNISPPMGPSNSNLDSMNLSTCSNIDNDTCANYASVSGADVSINDQAPAEQEVSHSSLILGRGA